MIRSTSGKSRGSGDVIIRTVTRIIEMSCYTILILLHPTCLPHDPFAMLNSLRKENFRVPEVYRHHYMKILTPGWWYAICRKNSVFTGLTVVAFKHRLNMMLRRSEGIKMSCFFSDCTTYSLKECVWHETMESKQQLKQQLRYISLRIILFFRHPQSMPWFSSSTKRRAV
jgi:hypothetical protein